MIYEDELTGTKLINLEKADPDDFEDTVYIGGEADFYDYEHSVHANPYSVNEQTGREAQEKYKTHFYRKILEDEEYLEDVLDLKGKTLLSWMYPQHDHGEIIIKFLRNHEDEDVDIYDFIKEELEELDTSMLGIETLEDKEAAEEIIKEKY